MASIQYMKRVVLMWVDSLDAAGPGAVERFSYNLPVPDHAYSAADLPKPQPRPVFVAHASVPFPLTTSASYDLLPSSGNVDHFGIAQRLSVAHRQQQLQRLQSMGGTMQMMQALTLSMQTQDRTRSNSLPVEVVKQCLKLHGAWASRSI